MDDNLPDARNECIWWAVFVTHEPMVAKWSDTRQSFIDINRMASNFRILYGPATYLEAEAFIEDVYTSAHK